MAAGSLLSLSGCFQAVEARGQDFGQESVQFTQPLRAHGQQPLGSLASLVDQPNVLQDLQVLRDGGLRDVEVRCDLARAELAFYQEPENLPSLGLGDCLEDLHGTTLAPGLYKYKLWAGTAVLAPLGACLYKSIL